MVEKKIKIYLSMKFFFLPTGVLYPGGGLTARRFSYLMLVCSISLNCFINKLQDQLFQTATEMLVLADELSAKADDAAAVVEVNLLPAWEKFSASTIGRSLIERSGLPDAGEIQKKLDQIGRVRSELTAYSSMLRVVAMVLWIGNLIFWVMIARALTWLVMDFRYGRAKALVATGLAASLVINVCTHRVLESLTPAEILELAESAISKFQSIHHKLTYR